MFTLLIIVIGYLTYYEFSIYYKSGVWFVSSIQSLKRCTYLLCLGPAGGYLWTRRRLLLAPHNFCRNKSCCAYYTLFPRRRAFVPRACVSIPYSVACQGIIPDASSSWWVMQQQLIAKEIECYVLCLLNVEDFLRWS